MIQNGDVVYLNGFGVREAGSTQAVDADTMFMIGSVTKSMTTMLAATLVDDGRLTWETPLVDLLPAFAVGDPALTASLTVRDAFCNCIGIPGRDVELFFAAGTFTPEGVVTALADVAPTAARGERFSVQQPADRRRRLCPRRDGGRLPGRPCCGPTTSRCGSGCWGRWA